MIGLGLKKSTGIKWLADFRDPWTGVYYFNELKLSPSSFEKHRKMENDVLESADKVVSVGLNLKKNLTDLSLTKSASHKFEIITNGFDKEIETNLLQPSGDYFSIVYTGLFTKDQDHEAFWQALSELCSENDEFKNALRIITYGNIDKSILQSIEKNSLLDNFQSNTYVSLNVVNEVQRNAQLLLLCINHYPGEKEMLTGKLFDYICSGRPIMNIGPVPGDAAAIIAETKTGETFDRLDKNGIKEHLMKCFDLFKSKKLCVQPVNLMKYHRKSLTASLADMLKKM
jgi:hypothetical protein